MKFVTWHTTRKIFLASLVLAFFSTIAVLYYMKFELPDIEALKTTAAQAPLRLFSQSGKLIAEFGEKRSEPLPYAEIPQTLIDAVLATEDQHYFQHPGIDITGLMRAGVKLILTGRKEEGGSTITMQVARNFYLTRYKTFGRKLQEILLAIKIDHGLTKQKILELYLNTIFLGNRAYGVGAAAEIYYGKPLSQLSLDQYAMLAGLPKAPSNLNPIANAVLAKKRRDHVLSRMLELGYIKADAYKQAIAAPVNAVYHELHVEVKAPYAAEYARKQLEEMYGDSIYTDGYNVYTTIDEETQEDANLAVRDNLLAYDQRHGYRGPEQNLGANEIKNTDRLKKILGNIPTLNGLEAAIVTHVTAEAATAVRANGEAVTIKWANMSWARRQINPDFLGHVPHAADEVLQAGSVIRIIEKDNGWQLAQLPQAEAGMVALDPQNGAIRALVGGFDFHVSSFNRMTEAQRQPGSSFKPFIYSAALDKGYTLATVINDAPIVVENPDQTLWRPQNDTRQFYGPTRLREALVHSRNLVSIRLLQQIEVPYAVEYTERFGFTAPELPASLSLALGTASVTPLEMASGYAVFANGGFKVTPYIIDRIQNSRGQVIYQAKPLTACLACKDKPADNSLAPHVISAQNAYLITSALHDVIQYGTAAQARSLKRNDLAGKTGTTNNQMDAWFAGYNADLIALTWMGYDEPRSLHEYGAKAALPMWIEFMDMALRNKPEHSLQEPPDIMSIRIDPVTGALAATDNQTAIPEYFMEPYLPTNDTDNRTDGAPAPTNAQAGALY
jgi:penicillin-binding protein 1A